MTALRSVFAEFGVTFDKKGELKRGNTQVNNLVGNLKRLGVAVAGAFSARATVGFIRGIADQADALGKQAQALGISAEALNRWQAIAKFTNASAEAIGKAMTDLQVRIGQAAKEGSEQQKALEQLGLTQQELARQSPDKAFETVARALGNLSDESQRAFLGQTLLGEGVRQLGPLLRDVNGNLREADLWLAATGKGLSGATGGAARLNDGFTGLSLAVDTLKGAIGETLFPTPQDLEAFRDGLGKVRKALEPVFRNATVIKSVLAAIGVLIAATIVPAVALFAGAVAAVSTPVWAVVGAITAVSTAIGVALVHWKEFRDSIQWVLDNPLKFIGQAFRDWIGLLARIATFIPRTIGGFLGFGDDESTNVRGIQPSQLAATPPASVVNNMSRAVSNADNRTVNITNNIQSNSDPAQIAAQIERTNARSNRTAGRAASRRR